MARTSDTDFGQTRLENGHRGRSTAMAIVTRRQPCSFIIKDVRGRLGYWMGDGFKWTRERLLAQRFATQATAG